MAVVVNNIKTEGLRGSLGTLVYRQVLGKTVVSKKPKTSGQSALQKENRNKFKLAAAYAKEMMLNPQKKSYYQHKAKKLNLPNAYTAAITDYMRRGGIINVDTRAYKGKAGDVIKMKVQKKDFSVKNVRVSLHTVDGELIEYGEAVKTKKDVFVFTVRQTMNEKVPLVLRVAIGEATHNRVVKDFEMRW